MWYPPYSGVARLSAVPFGVRSGRRAQTEQVELDAQRIRYWKMDQYWETELVSGKMKR